jgi:DNA-damage-inducible protein J
MARKTGTGTRRPSKRATPGKSAQVRARIDPDVKHEAERILEELGLTPSSAISAFYRQIVLRQALPFSVAIPNTATAAAIQDAQDGTDLIEADDLLELMGQLLSKRNRTVDLVRLLEDNPELLEVLNRDRI